MRARAMALGVLCLGVLIVVVDSGVVTVALPSIADELGAPASSMTWVLNAYMIPFGGFLLLGGRLGDLYGRRRLFLVGIGLFTVASLACGIARLQPLLLLARAAQGIGGALIPAISLALITDLFPKPAERAQAVGIYGFVCAAGGGLGDVLGGSITQSLNWHWIFLINIPIGLVVFAMAIVLLPEDSSDRRPQRLDIGGAVSITAASTALIYTFIQANETGWLSWATFGLLTAVTLLIVLFIGIETRSPEPLIPFRLFRKRNFVAANAAGALWSAGLCAWSVIAALYLQRIFLYEPFRVGLAFLPSELVMATISASISARLASRFGVREPAWMGLSLAAGGLALFALAPVSGDFAENVLPGMLLIGLGGGIASAPLLLAATNDASSSDSGLASGAVNTSFMLGGAIGLASLASVADLREGQLHRSGVEALAALSGGYHAAFLGGALLIMTAAIIAALFFRPWPKTVMLTETAPASLP